MTSSIDPSRRNSQRELEALAACRLAEAEAKKPEANRTPLTPTWTREPNQSRGPNLAAAAAALRSDPGEEKVNAAREGINSVARELSGHGVDVNRLAQQFSSSRYAGTPNASVQDLARQAFIGEALKAHPELADRVNTIRMRALPQDIRSTVLTGMTQVRSTGASKVATCEGMIRAAEQAQKKPTAAPVAATAAAETPSPAEAIQRVKTEGVEAKRLMEAVNAENRKITTVSRDAEGFTGLAHASTALPGLIAGAARGHFGRAVENAAHSGAFIVGELTQKQAQVRQAYGACVQSYGRYTEANAQYQQALQSRDYQAIPGLARRCQDLGGQFKTEASRFAQQSEEAQRMEGHFDEAIVGVVAHALLMAVSLGGSSVMASTFGHEAELVGEVGVVGPIQSEIAEAVSHRVVADRKKH